MPVTVDRSKFLFYSPDPIDQITASFTGEIALAGSANDTDEITHGLGYQPLYYVRWSTTADFSVSYEEGIGAFLLQNLVVRTDGTKLYVLGGNNSASPVTVYYRIITFMPTNVDVSAPESQSTLDDFVFNTSYNYSKIFDQGVLSAATGTVSHNLGYYPQVEAWYIRGSDGLCVRATDQEAYSGSPYANGSPYVRLTTTDLVFGNGTSVTASAWHYKIYWDEF